MSQSASQPAKQPASQQAYEPASKPASQPASRPASQPASQQAYEPVSKPASQPANAMSIPVRLLTVNLIKYHVLTVDAYIQPAEVVDYPDLKPTTCASKVCPPLQATRKDKRTAEAGHGSALLQPFTCQHVGALAVRTQLYVEAQCFCLVVACFIAKLQQKKLIKLKNSFQKILFTYYEICKQCFKLIIC